MLGVEVKMFGVGCGRMRDWDVGRRKEKGSLGLYSGWGGAERVKVGGGRPAHGDEEGRRETAAVEGVGRGYGGEGGARG